LKRLKRVRPGERTRADQQNEQTDAIIGNQNILGAGGTLVTKADYGAVINGDGAFNLAIHGRIIAATNASDGAGAKDFSAGDIVQIDGLPIDADQDNAMFEDQTPDCIIPDEDTWTKMALVLEDIRQGSMGRVMTSGFALANVVRHADHLDEELSFAKAVDGETTLTMSVCGLGDVGWEQDVEDFSKSHLAWVFLPDNFIGASGDPATIGSTGETEAADTDTWDRDDPPADKYGVESIELYRIAYDDSGDEKLYAYYRTKTYDNIGRLVSISAETRVIIDTPEDC